MKKCPFCAKENQEAAIKCDHCGSIVDGSSSLASKPVASPPASMSPERELKAADRKVAIVVGVVGSATLVGVLGMIFGSGGGGGSGGASTPLTTPPSPIAPTCELMCKHVMGCQVAGDTTNGRSAELECVYDCAGGKINQGAITCWQDTRCSEIHRTDGLVWPDGKNCPSIARQEGEAQRAEAERKQVERTKQRADLQADLNSPSSHVIPFLDLAGLNSSPKHTWLGSDGSDLYRPEDYAQGHYESDALVRLLDTSFAPGVYFRVEGYGLPPKILAVPDVILEATFTRYDDLRKCREAHPEPRDEFQERDFTTCTKAVESDLDAILKANATAISDWRKRTLADYSTNPRRVTVTASGTSKYDFNSGSYVFAVHDRPGICGWLAGDDDEALTFDPSLLGWALAPDPNWHLDNGVNDSYFPTWALPEASAREKKTFADDVREIDVAVVVDRLISEPPCGGAPFGKPRIALYPFAYRLCPHRGLDEGGRFKYWDPGDRCGEWITPH